ncbi:MAG: hypothetical protein MUC49_06885 [Raineya sp.]|jgi:hypothetical protein|nr:hypothetical protein [Raineya sp.]
MKVQKLTIQTYRIVALWAFVECSLGGLAHALKLPFTGIYVGGGSIFCIVLLARFAGVQHILPALATVLSLKFALNPHSPIGAYLAVAFQGIAGYLLFRFSPFHGFNTIFLGFIGLLESALQKILVLTLLYGKAFYQVLDKIITETAKIFAFFNYPNSFHLFGFYVLLYACMGILIGILIHHYTKYIANYQSFESFAQDIESLKPETATPTIKNSFKIWKPIITLVSISVFLYIWGDGNIWKSLLLSIFMIFLWYWGLMKFVVWLAKKLNWGKWIDLKAQQDIIQLIPTIKSYWLLSYHVSKARPIKERLFTFIHLFVGQVLFRLESLPQGSKQDV